MMTMSQKDKDVAFEGKKVRKVTIYPKMRNLLFCEYNLICMAKTVLQSVIV